MAKQIEQKDIDEMMEKLKASWGWLVAFGVISLIGGFLCFANPLAATITADYLAGFFFLVLGIAQVISGRFRSVNGAGFSGTPQSVC